MKTLQLSNKCTSFLIKLPENGMGYQLVKVVLKNGKILRNHKVLNCSMLLLEKNESLNTEDIEILEEESN